VGREPKVVGNAFALDANKLSAQLKYRCVCCKNNSTESASFKDHADYVAQLKAQSGVT
jgi:peptidyl-prolyl cis-trans isomerase D